MAAPDLNPQTFETLLSDARAEAEGLARKLAEIAPEDPEHWAPNLRRAFYVGLVMRTTAAIDSHLGAGLREATKERYRARLLGQIRERPEWVSLGDRLIELGVLERAA